MLIILCFYGYRTEVWGRHEYILSYWGPHPPGGTTDRGQCTEMSTGTLLQSVVSSKFSQNFSDSQRTGYTIAIYRLNDMVVQF